VCDRERETSRRSWSTRLIGAMSPRESATPSGLAAPGAWLGPPPPRPLSYKSVRPVHTPPPPYFLAKTKHPLLSRELAVSFWPWSLLGGAGEVMQREALGAKRGERDRRRPGACAVTEESEHTAGRDGTRRTVPSRLRAHYSVCHPAAFFGFPSNTRPALLPPPRPTPLGRSHRMPHTLAHL
jgi:hypothetical protein